MRRRFDARLVTFIAPIAMFAALPFAAPPLVMAASASAPAAPVPLRPAGPPEIVVYPDDMAYVRDPRKVSLAAGENEVVLEGVPQRLDSTSVRLTGAGLDVREQSFRYDLWNGDKVFRRFLGDSIFFRWQGKSARGVLEGIDGDDLFIRRRDSTEVLLMIKRGQLQEIEFPARRGSVSLATRPSLRWRVKAAKAGEADALLSYLTGALGWTTEYTATLEKGEAAISLSGWATISNRSGAAYERARVSLVAGELRRSNGAENKGTMELEAKPEPGGTRPGDLFAYHVYPVGDPIDLPAWGSIQVPVVQAAKIAASRAYRYDGARDGSKVRAQLVFANEKGSGLGIPLPAGRVRVFAPTGSGAIAPAGENEIGHTPVGETVKLFCGFAFDFPAERTRIAHTRVARNVTEDQFEIKIRNASAADATVTVAETLYGAWEITQKSTEFRKKSADEIEFDLPVPAHGERVLTYTVRYTY